MTRETKLDLINEMSTFNSRLLTTVSSHKLPALFIGISLIFLLIALPLNLFLLSQQSHIRSGAQSFQQTQGAIYFGVYTKASGTNQIPLTTFEKDAGKKVSIVHVGYYGWPSAFPASELTLIRNHGAIPLITWISNSDKLADITAGKYDKYITNFAKAAKLWRYPFFLRFDHEMNGNWYGWSEKVNGNTQGQFIPMWRHVHDIFTKIGANNVTWVWCPSNNRTGQRPFDVFYPGDAYVDWTCMDGYNKYDGPQGSNPWLSFGDIFSSSYEILTTQVAPTKPIMIGEDASTEDSRDTTRKAAWFTDLLTIQLPQNFPLIKAYVLFNVYHPQDQSFDYRIESSHQAQIAFQQGISSSYYAANTFSSIYCSKGYCPIPPPKFSSPTPIPQPSLSLTPTIPLSPSSSPSISPTIQPSTTSGNTTSISLTICPHGLGNCGDNTNPSSQGNTTPKHSTRIVTVIFKNLANIPVATESGTVTYVPASQSFQGILDVPNLPSGQYLITIRTNGFLGKQLPTITTITPGASLQLPEAFLTSGDSDNNNQLTILDYQALLSCFDTKVHDPSCIAPITDQNSGADINDDGIVDGVDYNIFIREILVQQGAD